MKKNSKNIDVYVNKALETLPYSEVLSRNAIALINADLMGMGFQALPVITLTGAPGTDKTTVARYCIIENLEPERCVEQDSWILRNC